jgi:hypothetical protein
MEKLISPLLEEPAVLQPKLTGTNIRQKWKVSGSLVINPEVAGKAQSLKGFFIIATNEMDRSKISVSDYLNSLVVVQ